jgi:hypothetical protein
MHLKVLEEEYLKLEPAIDEMSEQLTYKQTANSSSNTESTSCGEMSGVDPMDSRSGDSNRPNMYPYMVEGL